MSLPAKVKDLFSSTHGSASSTAHDDSAAATSTSTGQDDGKHHNKLHKPNDPRGWTDEERAAQGHNPTEPGVGLSHGAGIKHPHDSGTAIGGGYYGSEGAVPAGRDHSELSTAGRDADKLRSGSEHPGAAAAGIAGTGSHSALQDRHQQPVTGTSGSGLGSSSHGRHEQPSSGIAGTGSQPSTLQDRHQQPSSGPGAIGATGSHSSTLQDRQQQPLTGTGAPGPQSSLAHDHHGQGLAGAAGVAGAGAGLSALHDRHQQPAAGTTGTTGTIGTEPHASTLQDRYQPTTGLAAAAVPGATSSDLNRPTDRSTDAHAPHQSSHAGAAAVPAAIGLASSHSGNNPATRENTNLAGNPTTRDNINHPGAGTSHTGQGAADTPYWGDLPRGAGVYNGVTGHGSGEETTQHSSLPPHGSGVYNTVLGHGSAEDDLLHKGTGTGTGSGLGAQNREHQTPEQRQFMLRPQGQQNIDDRVNEGGLQHTERTDQRQSDRHHGAAQAAGVAGAAGAAGLAGHSLSREHGHGHQEPSRTGLGSDATREAGTAHTQHEHAPLAHRTKHTSEETRTHEPTHTSSHGHHGATAGGLFHRDHKETPHHEDTSRSTYGATQASSHGPSVTTGIAGQHVPTTSSSTDRALEPTSSRLGGADTTHHGSDNHHATAGAAGLAGAGAAAAYGIHHQREGHNAASGEQPHFDAQAQQVPSSRGASAHSQAISSTSQAPQSTARDSTWTPATHSSTGAGHDGHRDTLAAGTASGLHGNQTGSTSGSHAGTGLATTQDRGDASRHGHHNVLSSGTSGTRDNTNTGATHGGQHNVLSSGPSSTHGNTASSTTTGIRADPDLPTTHSSKDPSHGGMYKVLPSGTPSGINPEFGHRSESGAHHTGTGVSHHAGSGLTSSESRHESDGHSKALGGAAAGAGLGAAALGAHSAHERSAQPGTGTESSQLRDTDHLRNEQAEKGLSSSAGAPGSSTLGSGALGASAPGSSGLGGRKVTHTCHKCGAENDISSYFTKNN